MTNSAELVIKRLMCSYLCQVQDGPSPPEPLLPVGQLYLVQQQQHRPAPLPLPHPQPLAGQGELGHETLEGSQVQGELRLLRVAVHLERNKILSRKEPSSHLGNLGGEGVGIIILELYIRGLLILTISEGSFLTLSVLTSESCFCRLRISLSFGSPRFPLPFNSSIICPYTVSANSDRCYCVKVT